MTLNDNIKPFCIKIAGEIVFSEEPGSTMRRWREFFDISQKRLSEKIGLSSSSVISDYESGRRKNPGVHFIRRLVQALFEIDEERGGNLTRELAQMTSSPTVAVLDVKKFPIPITIRHFIRAISGETLTKSEGLKKINSLILIDNEDAIKTLSGLKFLQLFDDKTKEKAFLFTNIKQERTPLVALRFSLLKPKVVIYHGFHPSETDIELAESEDILLIYSKVRDIKQLEKSLQRLYHYALSKRPKKPEGNPKISN